MFNKIKNWLKPDENYQVGRPKIAEQKLKKTVKIEIALAFVLCATLVLSGTSALTGKSPIELLSFGTAGKASGNIEGTILEQSTSIRNLTCGSKVVGTYKLYFTTANDAGGGIHLDRLDSFGVETWSKSQKLRIQILSGNSGEVHAFRYKIVNNNGANTSTLCSGTFAVPSNMLDKYPSIAADITFGGKDNKGNNIYPTMSAKVYGGGSYIGILNRRGVNEIGGVTDYRAIKLDNYAPSITALTVSKSSSNKGLTISASVKDGGEMRGKMVYNIYTFNRTLGKSVKLVTSKSELYNAKQKAEGKTIDFGDGNANYKIIASVIDDAGNKGKANKHVCFNITSGIAKTISCKATGTTTKPGTTKPTTKPGTTKPTTKPGTTKPTTKPTTGQGGSIGRFIVTKIAREVNCYNVTKPSGIGNNWRVHLYYKQSGTNYGSRTYVDDYSYNYPSNSWVKVCFRKQKYDRETFRILVTVTKSVTSKEVISTPSYTTWQPIGWSYNSSIGWSSKDYDMVW